VILTRLYIALHVILKSGTTFTALHIVYIKKDSSIIKKRKKAIALVSIIGIYICGFARDERKVDKGEEESWRCKDSNTIS